MSKIEKFLKKLSHEERQIAKDILIKILSGELQGFDIKKLRGHKDLYRVRKGGMRVIFYKERKYLNVVFIGKRGDSKYKQF